MPNANLSRAARVAALAILALAAAPRAAAQDQPGLTLDDVVRRTLSTGPEVRSARARADAVRGRARSAGARFDTQLGASVGASQQSANVPTQAGLAAATSQTAAYTVEATRQLRSGIRLQPRLMVDRTAQDGVAMADATSTVSLNVGVPLLRDRLGRSSGAGERAMELMVRAGDEDIRYIAEAVAASTAGAYWDYAAACARVRVYEQAEDRARRRLDETRALVAADERPASELNPLQAALARARQQRIGAEQGVDEARVQLGLALGLNAADMAALPAPSTPFPAVQPWDPTPAQEEALVRVALERRGDLAAYRLEVAADGIVLAGALDGLKPALDLNLSVGYAGRRLGTGYGGLVEPLYRDLPGLNAALRVEYRFAPARSDAAGQAMQARAAKAEREVRAAELERQVAGGVAVGILAVRRGAASLAEAERAEALYRATIEDEQARHRLGASTLFDVIYAEENLTSAQLALVNSRAQYARALASLRAQTATLAEEGPQGPAVDASRLLTTP